MKIINILFVTLCDINSINDRNIYTDLLRQFIRNGHSVYIVSPIERRYNRNIEIIGEGNSTLLKVKIGNIQKTNVIEKGISTILLEYKFKSGIKRYFNNINFDLVLYSTPPITFEKVIKYVKKKNNCLTYLMLKDIFPQNAVDINMMRNNGILHRYFRRKEVQLYKVSDVIGCMSEANKAYILKNNRYIEEKKIEVCPNSIELGEILEKDIEEGITSVKPKEIDNYEDKFKIREKYNIPKDSVVFIYGGNLGKPQGIDFLIDVLKANKYRKDVFFIIIGNGTEYRKLDKVMNENSFSNARLYNSLPKVEYDKFVNASDIGMIFLDRRFTIPNFPSRLLTYMEYSLPVIAATDKSTDLGVVIEKGGFGYWSESGDVEAFNKNINKIIEEKRILREMGKIGHEYLKMNYISEISYNIIMKHLKEEPNNV